MWLVGLWLSFLERDSGGIGDERKESDSGGGIMKGFCDAVEGEVGVKGGNVEEGLEV